MDLIFNNSPVFESSLYYNIIKENSHILNIDSNRNFVEEGSLSDLVDMVLT